MVKLLARPLDINCNFIFLFLVKRNHFSIGKSPNLTCVHNAKLAVFIVFHYQKMIRNSFKKILCKYELLALLTTKDLRKRINSQFNTKLFCYKYCCISDLSYI